MNRIVQTAAPIVMACALDGEELECADWVRMLEKTPTERVLRERLARGIPESVRPRCWMELSGASREHRAGVYDQLLDLGEWKTGIHAQIEIDIPRSGVEDTVKQDALRRVLRAYARFAPSTACCQQCLEPAPSPFQPACLT